MLGFIFSPSFIFMLLASTTPVLLATLAAAIVNSAGMVNLGIEGTMLSCALAGVLVSAYTQSLILGALFGVVIGIVISFIFGYFSIFMRAPRNAVGVGINLTARGGTVFILATVTGSKISSSSLKSLTFPNITIPLVDRIPVIGKIVSGHNFITYLAWFFVLISWFLLYKTRLGRNIRAVGESEDTAKAVGINVNLMRFITLTFCGFFSAIGGMYLSMGSLKSFTADMVAGRGFLALALSTMAQGNPVYAFFSSLSYGFADTLSVYLQLYSGLDLKLIEALPYVFVIAVLILNKYRANYFSRKKLQLR